MDNQEKLLEGLLKADGIDPAGPTESERIAFGEMLDEQSKSKQSESGSRLDIWRIIMKTRITKFAAAAVILIAAIIGIDMLGGSPDIAGVALADVAKSIEQVKNAVFKKTVTISSEDGGTNAFDSLVYYSKAAVREDTYDNKKITRQVYVKFSDKIVIGMNHKARLFQKIDLADEDAEKLSPITPKDIVNRLLSKGKYKRLGRKEVGGVVSEGFEFNDKRALLSMDKDKIENVVMRLWVDVDTNLPIRAELAGVLTDNSKANVVMYDPQWDVELESDFFEPNIPPGYIKPEQRGFVGINLEDWPTLKVVPGMAAEEAGVKDGDVVLKINGDSIVHIKSAPDAQDLLFGKIGEKVTLTVTRGEQILSFEIARGPLKK